MLSEVGQNIISYCFKESLSLKILSFLEKHYVAL